MKCEYCKNKIEEHFLNKPLGTMIKDSQGKKHWFCNKCQKLGKETLLRKTIG